VHQDRWGVDPCHCGRLESSSFCVWSRIGVAQRETESCRSEVEQSMQQYSKRQLLILRSEIKVHQEYPRCIKSMLCRFRVEIRAWRGGYIARRLDNHADMVGREEATEESNIVGASSHCSRPKPRVTSASGQVRRFTLRPLPTIDVATSAGLM